ILPTWPIVAKHSMLILRISPDGILTDAYSPSLATSCTDDPALRAICPPRPQLHVVQERAERDVLERERVARQDVDVLSGDDRVADLQSDRLQDVALLAVGVGQQRDPRRPVRVVLDRRHLRRNVQLVALEVDDAVHPLVAAAAPPRREVPLVVAAAGAVHRLDERLVRLLRGDVVERLHGLKPRAGRRRVQFAKWHTEFSNGQISEWVSW